MLTHREASDIARFVESIRQTLVGYRDSPQQAQMMEAVAQAFDACLHGAGTAETDGSNLLVCESGTGTGKTFAYAIPGIVLARSVAKKLVISSSTIALQEQLAGKDLPLLQACAPWPFSFAVAKGRQRYVCVARLEDAVLQGRQGRLDGMNSESQVERVALLRSLHVDLERGRWDGDRDHLAEPVPDDLWPQLTTERAGCAGNRCPRFADCALYRARRLVKEADVIVANHDLVLSAQDAAHRGGLPDPADCFFVFDEAHALPSKLIEHHAARHLLKGSLGWLQQVPELAMTIVQALRLEGGVPAALEAACREARHGVLALSRWLDAAEGWHDGVLRFAHGVVPVGVVELGEPLLASLRSVQDTLTDLRARTLKAAGDAPELAQLLLAELGRVLAPADATAGTWSLMLRADTPGFAPTARWFERSDDDVLVCASPIAVGDRVERALWRRVSAAVLTSATLTSSGSWQLFRQQTGLDRLPAVATRRFASPFDYAAQARLVVPRMRSSARCAEAHTAEVTEIVQGLLATEPAMLVLFESATQMARVHAGLGELQDRVLMQGALAKRELLRRHRARIDAGEPSAIFGLAAMREGVDLPGAYCTHVVIAKLPFSVPTRPWEQARAEWVRRCGRSPFAELVLPEAGIRLAQAVGRLIRGHRDRGTVTILDDRLVRRRYGPDLLRSLPPMRLEVFGRPTDLQALAHLDSAAVPGTLAPQDNRPEEDLR